MQAVIGRERCPVHGSGPSNGAPITITVMPELPDGVVTFLFTDVEGSTRLWEEAPDSMMAAIRQHDAEIEGAAEVNNGIPVRPRGEGDSRFVVFRKAADAAAAALGDLEAEMEPTGFAAASARGSARSYDVAAKELLESL